VASQTVVNLCSSVTVVSTRAQILWLDSKVLKYFQHEIAIKSLNLKKYAHLVTVLTECACFFSALMILLQFLWCWKYLRSLESSQSTLYFYLYYAVKVVYSY